MKNNILKLGKYRHYKGGMVEVIAVAHHSETLEELIVYKTLYDNRTFGKGSVWVRPKRMFTEDVKINGKKVPRFEYILANNLRGVRSKNKKYYEK